MDPGLILALGTFLQVRHLFVCLGDDDFSLTRDDFPWMTARLEQEEIMQLLLRKEYQSPTLVACQDFDPRADGFTGGHFGPGFAWLVPHRALEKDPGDLPLALDSFLIGASQSGRSGYRSALETPLRTIRHRYEPA